MQITIEGNGTGGVGLLLMYALCLFVLRGPVPQGEISICPDRWWAYNWESGVCV